MRQQRIAHFAKHREADGDITPHCVARCDFAETSAFLTSIRGTMASFALPRLYVLLAAKVRALCEGGILERHPRTLSH